jgi:hypothetical protein
MQLPHAGSAILDIRKLAQYCLDPVHPRGRHKERVFREALGLVTADAHWLSLVLLESVLLADAVELDGDMYGHRWRVDVPASRHGRQSMVRTLWIVRTGEQVPRFVTCWVV